MNRVYSAIMRVGCRRCFRIVPVEFEQRDGFKITDMIGYGTYIDNLLVPVR